MLETVDLSQKLPSARFKKLLPSLQTRLRHLEQSVREAGLPVLISFEGWDFLRKGGALRLLAPALKETAPAVRHATKASSTAAAQVLEEMPTLLDRVDLSLKLTEKAYVKQLNGGRLAEPSEVGRLSWSGGGNAVQNQHHVRALDDRGRELQVVAPRQSRTNSRRPN